MQLSSKSSFWLRIGPKFASSGQKHEKTRGFRRRIAHKHEKTITRHAKWDNQCKTWNSKKGIPCMTYFDVDANGYRTATGQYEVLNA